MEPELIIIIIINSKKGSGFLQGRNTPLLMMCQSRKKKFRTHLTVARSTLRYLMENTEQSGALQIFTLFLKDLL